MRPILLALVLALVLGLLPSSLALGGEVDVYLLGGQSNMQGIGKVANLPKGTPLATPEVFFFDGKAFVPLQIGTTKTSSRAGEFGPEFGMALGLGQGERPIYLIKFHASGMPLHHGWNRNRWEGGEPAKGRVNFYPGEKPESPTAGTLYQNMRKRFQAGLAALEAEGHKATVRGFAWMQGEQDSKHEVSAGSYALSLGRLRDRIAEDLALKSLPMAFGQVLPHTPALERFTHRELIRAQMAAADHRSEKPEALPLVRMVSTDGFGLKPDTVHYDAAGQLALGRALAKALRELGSGE